MLRCPARLILPDLIILKVSGKGYKLWIFSLYSFLQPHDTSIRLRSDNLDRIKTLNPYETSDSHGNEDEDVDLLSVK